MDKQRSTNCIHKSEDRVTQPQLKTGGELRRSGMVNSLNPGFFLQEKICPFLAQGIYIYVCPYFTKHSWTNSLNLSSSLE